MMPSPSLQTFPLDGPPPRFEAGWMPYLGENDRLVGYAAFRRPYSEDWYDLVHCATWWHAAAVALQIAVETPDCEYIGGPGQ